MNKLDDLVDKYVKSVITHGEASWNGDYKTANKYFKIYTKCFCQITKYGKEGENALRELLNHTNHFVRCSAAYHMLPFDSSVGISSLKKCKDDTEGVGLNAKTTISEWNSGNIKFPIDKDGKIIYVTVDEFRTSIGIKMD